MFQSHSSSENKRLGVAQQKRRYDLPLQRSSGTRFLILLVGLMTFLACAALIFSYGLNQIMAGWSDGLENKVTLEIAATNTDGKAISANQIKTIKAKLQSALQNKSFVKSLDVLSEDEITKMIQPWLGQSLTLDDLPVPGLITVHLQNDIDALDQLKETVLDVNSSIKIDTHERWLSDLFRLTSSLQFAMLCVVLVIAGTTVIAVASATKSQIDIHKDDVELLHLMGAQDSYITNQFLKHMLRLSLIGGALGVLVAMLTVSLLKFAMDARAFSLLPNFEFDWVHVGTLCALPLGIACVATLSARYTVLRVLKEMP